MNILSPSIRGFTYNRAIIALVAVMLATLAVIDLAVIRQQRDSIMRDVRHRATMEMEQAATAMTEPLLKYQFANIEQFVQQWAAGNHEVVNFTAITPSGHILTSFQRPISGPHRFTVEKKIAFQGRHLLTLVLEKDFSHAEALLSQLKFRLLFTSLYISAALGITLWFVFRFLAIRPLEQEVSSRRQAELALEKVNQQLEERVQARTKEISTLLDQEIRHREALTRLTAERTANYEETIFTFVDMIEQRDTYTAGHTGRVAEYCRLIAEAMGINESETTRLYRAAILHDIGKLATPDAVLLKPGKLSPLDRELIKLHAAAGHHMLSGIAMYKDLSEVILHHHERYDGEGYPDRLQGKNIPFLSRILTVADSFDAMTTNRIYKPRKDVAAALTELRLLGGKQFDPDVVAAAIALLPPAAFAAEKKANSIDELAKMYDVTSCKGCHAEIFAEWEKSFHATSLIGSPRTMATIASTIKDGLLKEYTHSGAKEVKDLTVEHMMICAKCHLPQLKNATDAVAREIAQAAIDGTAGDENAKNQLARVGINCLICHNQKALIHKWTDGEIDPTAVYGSKDGDHPDGTFTKIKKNESLSESIMCGQCHGLGPNFDLAEPTQCATLYGSYLHAYVPSGGSETCQDCHMKKDGHGHFMPGYRDPAVAKSAVMVEVDARGYYFLPKAGDSVPTAVVTVKMTSNAGHRIPDG